MTVLAAISAAAHIVGVPPALLLAVCFAESSHRNIHSPNDGGSASYGVCQIKLATAQMVSGPPSLTDASPLKEPYTNAIYAALYLKHLSKRYNSNFERTISAYNAGSARLCPSLLAPRSGQIDFGRFDTKHTKCNTKYVENVKRLMKETPWNRSQ